MSGERERLAEALADLVGEGTPDFWPDTASWADRLLVADGAVGRMLREAQAAALEAAREVVHTERFNADNKPEARWPQDSPKRPDLFYAGIVRAEAILRDRAAALRDQP